MLAKVIPVVAREDDDGVVRLPGLLQRVQHLAHLHPCKRRTRSTRRSLSFGAQIHLHIDAGLVVDARLGNVVPIAVRGWQRQLVVGQKGLEVLSRRDERHVRAHKADGEEERLAGVLVDQFHGLRCCLAIGMNQVIAVGFDHDKRIAAHDWFLAIWIAFQRLRCQPPSIPGRGC
jgi:hypothetical protein